MVVALTGCDRTWLQDTETPGMWEQFFSWRKPFSVEVWLSIAAMLIYSGCVYYYLEVVPMFSSGIHEVHPHTLVDSVIERRGVTNEANEFVVSLPAKVQPGEVYQGQ